MSETKKCDHCGGRFEARRATAQYCSAKCRVYANRAQRRGGKAAKPAPRIDWAKELKALSKQKVVTKESLAENANGASLLAMLRAGSRLQGYIVKDIGNGYRISKAVHFASETGDLKAEMSKLNEMAKNAIGRMASNSSLMRLSQSEQLEILSAVTRVTGPFTR